VAGKLTHLAAVNSAQQHWAIALDSREELAVRRKREWLGGQSANSAGHKQGAQTSNLIGTFRMAVAPDHSHEEQKTRPPQVAVCSNHAIPPR
jgi:hypothetical protein